MIVLLPLPISGVSGLLLDRAMRLANVRIKQPVIYAKAPYDELLPKSLIAKSLKAPEGYKAYEGISLLFKRFGSTTSWPSRMRALSDSLRSQTTRLSWKRNPRSFQREDIMLLLTSETFQCC